jgi:hypothetical protein
MRIHKVSHDKMCINTHIAIGLEECYFHSCRVAAQYTLRGVGGRGMDTRIRFVGQNSGSFLLRSILIKYSDLFYVISHMATGEVLQKFFKFTPIHTKIRKNYFLFKDFKNLRNIGNWFILHILSRKSMCISQTNILFQKSKLPIALIIAGH